jgi:4-oxalocrotonate tautomerase family enzyme
MPTATVDGPELDLEKKRELSRKITDALEEAYGLPRRVLVVVIKENPPENVCTGGEMICDRIERLRKEEEEGGAGY